MLFTTDQSVTWSVIINLKYRPQAYHISFLLISISLSVKPGVQIKSNRSCDDNKDLFIGVILFIKTPPES